MRWVKKEIKKRHPSVIHFCDLDSCFLSVKYCFKKKIPYVYDVFDYYIDSHNIPRLFSSLVEKREIYAINNSSCTIICTEERKEQITKSKPSKVIVVHNSAILKNLSLEDKPLIYDYVYCGSLDDVRLISEILDLYPKNRDLNFLFAGYGPLANRCVELSNKFENFTFLQSIPYSEVLNIERQARCLSAIYKPTMRNHVFCAPNKFYESLCLGKPVIVCEGTGIDKVIATYDIGKVIKYDAKDFYNAVRVFKESAELPLLSERAKKVFKEKYSWDEIMEPRLIEMYLQLLKY